MLLHPTTSMMPPGAAPVKSSRKGAEGSEASLTELEDEVELEAVEFEEVVLEVELEDELSVALAGAADPVADDPDAIMDAAASGLMVWVVLLAAAVPEPLMRTNWPRFSGWASMNAMVGPATMLLALARLTTLFCKGFSSEVT